MDVQNENTITITPRITANPPVLQDIEVTENGEYSADGSADGLGTVTVNVEPNNEEITVTENGEYEPSEDFDGISKVIVDVQQQINLETLNVDENGTYTPQTGFDGFGEVNVNIPAPVLDDINITENGEYNPVNDGFSKVTVDIPDPVLDDINITENGNYISEHDGFNNVTVAVPDKPLETKNITENGSYSPSQGIYGFSQVTVDVQPDNEELNVVQNGIYTPSVNKDGFSKVNVAVPDKPLEIKNINTNGQYTPSSGYYGFSEVNVNVQPSLEEKTITENGTYTPSSGYYGFSEVNVSVDDSIAITASYSNGVLSWNVDSEYSDTYSNVFVNNTNIYNGSQLSCNMRSTTSGNVNIKIFTFDKTKLKTGCLSYTENIPNSILLIQLESNQTVSSLKFDDVESVYSDNMPIPLNVTDIKVTVSKTDNSYNNENRSEITYRNSEYTFEQTSIGKLYSIKPYNLPILSQSDRVSATECHSSDLKFIAKTDSEWSESEGSTYKLFDNNNTTFWNTLRTQFPHWILIYTEEKICIKKLMLQRRQAYPNEFPKRLIIQGSNDNETYVDISELIIGSIPDSEITLALSNDNYYNYYKINIYATFANAYPDSAATGLSELSFIALRE